MQPIRVRSAVVLSLALLAAPTVAAGPEPAPSLARADQAFAAHRVDEAMELYAAVSAAAGGQDDRNEAVLRLSLLEWRFLHAHEAARARLLAAVDDGWAPARMLLAVSELEQDRGQWEAARTAAGRALLLARTGEDTQAARNAWAAAVVGEAVEARRAGRPSPDPAALRDAATLLRGDVEAAPGELETSRRLVQAALLTGDGEGALLGWRSYWRVPPGGRPYGPLQPAAAVLDELLPRWPDGLDASDTGRLVEALAAGRFFRAAELVAKTAPRPLAEPASRVAAYAEWLRALERVTDGYYRRTALGEAKPDDLRRGVLEQTRPRWSRLGLPKGAIPAHPDALEGASLEEALDRCMAAVEQAFGSRFGTYVNLGDTAGYYDLHMGHAVLDERRTVSQYGVQAEVRFVALDAMVSNGFQSWAWAYRSQHGGWANEDGIYQVRPAYAAGPLEAWRRLTDPQAREAWDAEIARQSAEDDALASAETLAFLPGLRGRLERAALERVRAELASQGLTGPALRTAFLAEMEGAVQESSIFAHEGRHVIDKRAGITDRAELEYRAKLSEIALTDYPEAALANAVVAPNLGSHTPHGHAARRLLEGLLRWTIDHGAEIDGFDPRRPAASQLDRLTPAQLRAAVAAQDPLAAPREGG